MSRTILSTAVAGLLLSTGAMAASLPAAGEAPFSNKPTVSTLQRADVAVNAARQLPLAGNLPIVDAMAGSTLSRADVRAEAAQFTPAAGEGWVAEQHAAAPVSGSLHATAPARLSVAAGEAPFFNADLGGGSALARADVRVTADQLPLAGNLPGAEERTTSVIDRATVRAEAARYAPAAGVGNTVSLRMEQGSNGWVIAQGR